MQALQNNLGNNARWFRLGIVSATVVTPLVTRWRSLRAAERARALWEARPTSARLPPGNTRAINARLWLVGVVVGLVAAGTAAFVLIRRRQQSDAELYELPGVGANGKGSHLVEQARQLLGRSVRSTAAPAAVATVAPGAESAGRAAPEQQMAAGMLPTLESDVSAEMVEVVEMVEPTMAPFVGNTRTMVYHAADDEHLPAEENRVYFATAAQAEEAGFRADRGETPAHKS